MRKTKKALSTFLVILLIFGMSMPTNAELVSSGKVQSTIDSRLQSLLADASADTRIPVDVWLYENDTMEEREQKVTPK